MIPVHQIVVAQSRQLVYIVRLLFTTMLLSVIDSLSARHRQWTALPACHHSCYCSSLAICCSVCSL